jgi:hypothetical protein
VRRYTTFHSLAETILPYLSKGGVVLTGSMPVRTWRQAVDFLRPFDAQHGQGIVHFTLSMPRGASLSEIQWLVVARHVLRSSGLPPEQVPWLLWGREATSCDHVHIVSACQTFVGQPLCVATSVHTTDRLECDLRQRLGLPDLPCPSACLPSSLPKSRAGELQRSFVVIQGSVLLLTSVRAHKNIGPGRCRDL